MTNGFIQFDMAVCHRYETNIQNCFNLRKIANSRFQKHKMYHSSVIQKINSIYYFRNEIYKMIQGGTYDLTKMLLHFNVFVDGYLYSFISASDIFGQEINNLFNLGYAQKNVNFLKIYEELLTNHNSLDISIYFHSKISNTNISGRIKIANNSWYDIVRKYRNAITHRNILGLELIKNIEMDDHGIVHVDPYMPKLSDFNERSSRNLINFCDYNLNKLVEIINESYNIFITRIDNNERIPFH